MKPQLSRQAVLATAAGAIGLAVTAAMGVLAWSTLEATLGLLLLPLLMNLLRARYWPLLVALAYFGSGNWELPGIVARFFPHAGWLAALLAPALLTLIQALPFWLYRADRSPLERAIRMAGALALLVLPPVGWLTWRNPLLVSGLLYPGLGYAGLLGALALFACLAGGGVSLKPGRRAVAALGVMAALSSAGALWHARTHPAPPAWAFAAIQTRLPPPDRRDPNVVRKQVPGSVIAEDVEAYLPSPDIDVLVFPESILDPQTPADQIAIIPAAWKAKRQGVIVLVGASIADGPGHWRNTVQAFGALSGQVDESRLPMPLGNWRPGFGGVAAHPFASDLVILPTRHGAVQVAMSLCFEDTLIWPHPGLLSGRAKVMLSLGNAWSTGGTRGDRAQGLSAQLLARLGGVPLVRARNTWEDGHGE